MNEDLQSPNSLIPQENVKILMEEALELAQTATTMDKQGKYPAASDYYDLTILNLNECLSLLPKDSDVYKSILVFREKYNRRIEILSEGGSITSLLNTSSNHYDGRNSLVDGDASFMREITPYDSLDASNNDTNNTKRTSSPQKSNKKPAKLSSQDFNYALDFNDPKCKVIPELEAPPTGIILHSFWQMRIISTTIRHGGFLTPQIYIPKDVWTQTGAKFSGLSAKMQAFEHIDAAMDQFITPLKMKLSESYLEAAFVAFQSAMQEFNLVRKSLAKSFPYITPDDTDTDSTVLGQVDHASTHSKGGRISGVFNAIGNIKNSVMKIAEVGYSRLGTITMRASEHDKNSYALLVSSLCDKCQIFVMWYEFANSERDRLLNSFSRPGLNSGVVDVDVDAAEAEAEAKGSSSNTGSRGDNGNNSGNGTNDMNDDSASRNDSTIDKIAGKAEKVKEKKEEKEEEEDPEMKQKQVDLLENILMMQLSVGAFMQEIVCEVLLRDLQQLLSRYLEKTRKGFSRMHWNEAEDDDS